MAKQSSRKPSLSNNQCPTPRDSILNVAEDLVLQNGFAATSLDVIASALTEPLRSELVQHFPDKKALALELIKRYVKQDQRYFEDLFYRAQFLCDDPLQQMILFTNLLAESIVSRPLLDRGCLLATFARDQQRLEDEIQSVLADGLAQWRGVFLSHLKDVAAMYPPSIDVSLDDVSDMLTTLLEGGVIMARLLNDPQTMNAQIQHYRNYLRLLFEPLV